MKRLILILISLVWFAVISDDARACTCAETTVPVCAAFWRADAVFAGQLVDITPVEQTSGPPTMMLHFTVEQPFRGLAAGPIAVETLQGTSCDMEFKKGERYLVYASHEGDSNQLFAGPCTRTTHIKYADEDLNYLRTVTQQGAKESIMGRLALSKYEALAGVRVTVQNSDKTFETKTDEKGNFSVELPGPDSYTVRAFIPFAAAVMTYRADGPWKINATDALTTFEYEVQIAKSQCSYRELDLFRTDLHATAEVSGNVLTASGRPVSPGYVYLVKASAPDQGVFRELAADGSFKFEGVAAGEYYLVLNPRNEAPDENDAPYPRTYYPNVAEGDAATKIVVTEDAKLENLTLHVRPRWKERAVAGKVVWQDGSVPRDAHIRLYDGNRYIRLIKLDEKGRFNFKIYGDFNYAIDAEAWRPKHGKSERVSVSDVKSTSIKLVLKSVQ